MDCGDGMCWQQPLCDVIDDLKDERDRYREALERIERDCGDDSRPEDNAVQIAREALAGTHDAQSPRKAD